MSMVPWHPNAYSKPVHWEASAVEVFENPMWLDNLLTSWKTTPGMESGNVAVQTQATISRDVHHGQTEVW